jgi:dethiobiotin synthetase
MPSSQPIPGLFFAGTDTEVGKTYQAAELARQLTDNRIRVGVYKPVASGLSLSAHDEELNPSETGSDANILCRAAGLSESLLSRICPQSFRAPLAPPVAAALEGSSVDESLLIEGARWWTGQCEFLIVEGAGGLCSPISSSMTVIDLARQLELPVVLVAANRLGCVSQILLAAEALQRRDMHLFAVVLNQLPLPIGSLTGAAANTGEAPGLTNQQLQQRHWYEKTVQSNAPLIQQHLPEIPLVSNSRQLVELMESSRMIRPQRVPVLKPEKPA